MPPSLQHIVGRSGIRLAYYKTVGKSPGAIFFPGFMSDMTGTKATSLESHFEKLGHAFVRFDYSGCGQSIMDDPVISFDRWRSDAIDILDKTTEGKQVLIGSSMGAWMSIMAALEFPARVAGLVLVAPALDFTGGHFKALPQTDQDRLNAGECFEVTDPRNGLKYKTSKAFFDESVSRRLLTNQDGSSNTIPLTCPVRIIHGIADDIVPYKNSVLITECLQSSDVEIVFRKAGGHRMSEPRDMALLMRHVDEMIAMG